MSARNSPVKQPVPYRLQQNQQRRGLKPRSVKQRSNKMQAAYQPPPGNPKYLGEKIPPNFPRKRPARAGLSRWARSMPPKSPRPAAGAPPRTGRARTPSMNGSGHGATWRRGFRQGARTPRPRMGAWNSRTPGRPRTGRVEITPLFRKSAVRVEKAGLFRKNSVQVEITPLFPNPTLTTW